MTLKTQRIATQTFLVLVPHRDTRLILRAYSDSLLKAGITTAYHFPLAAPIAALSRPFTTDELKHCARSLREASLSLEEGTIRAEELSCVEFPAPGKERLFLFGPHLNLAVPSNTFTKSAEEKTTALFSPLIAGVCLLPSDNSVTSGAAKGAVDGATKGAADGAAVPPSQLSFRAAAVANMLWQPVQTAEGVILGYRWKIGALCWLPALR